MIDQTTEKGGRTTEAQGRSENAVNQGSQGNGPSLLAVPSISLPKGGGAIRGIGEKFTANPVTGAGSMSVPIALTPGRSGFAPQLTLSYDSGAGNGPFGLGWNLSLPAITRKTDKGLPLYNDAKEPDVFILSGAEDLVPVLTPDGSRFEDTNTSPNYKIHRYRPRIEGLFARIERWTHKTTGEIHWRSITKDNVTTLYGKDNNSRIFDPGDSDPGCPTRIFSWLICASYDDKGNAIIYKYKPEDSDNVDLSRANERNRIRSANRHLKCIQYGNRKPNRDANWDGADPHLLQNEDWMFEVVFDYGEHDANKPKPSDAAQWLCRRDPFSAYRSGFEIRTYRLCRRVLMFHHFPAELRTDDYLVRSTEFQYDETPIATFIKSVTQSGYVLQNNGDYLKKSLPPVEFTYSQAVIHEEPQEPDSGSLENAPYGLNGSNYQWVDLDGEGLPGILTEQADAWFYKRNLSPINPSQQGPSQQDAQRVLAKFAPVELVATKPNVALAGGQAQFMDLAGDGQPDLVVLEGPAPGFYEHDEGASWNTFRPFTSRINFDTRDPNLKFADLDGDGHADVLITEHEVFTWHPSLAEAGFGPARRVHKPHDEEKGPAVVFADGAQSIYLADLSGDGLTDLVRIRNGEVCYWPNLGYGRFGAKVTMDDAPWFDAPELFDQRRIRLADIDGSGVTDIIYLGGAGIQIYFNQSGNSWSQARTLPQFAPTDNLSSVTVVDLLGNGTACLVWSSPLPGDARRPMRYVDLMGGQKPHLLVKAINNLGAESHVHYASSTRFYLEDKAAGKPWITKLPFPVHVVERVETFDAVSRNRFVTRYKYHHGYFDGFEREFRGFGMVEQLDTEAFAAFRGAGALPNAINIDEASHVPPVLTRTWFHTGAFIDESRISKQFEREYYREGDASESFQGLTDAQLRAMSLDDTVLSSTLRHADGTRTPHTLTAEETLEACRSLKGAILRQEIYALDDTDEADRPYSASERNYTIELLQPRNGAKHAVFFTHPREQVDFHYERKLVEVNGRKRADPRVSHAMTLEVDPFGNALRSVAIGYRRRALPGVDAPEQQQTHLTLTVNRFANRAAETNWHRVRLPIETRAYEIVKPPEPGIADTRVDIFRFEHMEELTKMLFPFDQDEPNPAKLWPYWRWDWHRNPADAPPDTRLRLIEHVRTLYHKDDLSGPLALGEIDSMALPFESYKLAFTPDLAERVFVDSGKLTAAALNSVLANEGKYVHSEGDANWWIPSGRMFYSPGGADTPAQELAYARQHFFLPRRYRDPFHTNAVSAETFISYDASDLLLVETRDPVGNRITAGERQLNGQIDPNKPGNDYRVLQPRLVTDPNRNRTEIAFDALGLVVATAVKGKDDTVGDTLSGFEPDLTQAQLDEFFDAEDPHAFAASLLKGATTRIIYDLDRFRRTRQARPEDPAQWLPAYAATMARETHVSDPPPPPDLKIQISFSYSDGFGREIQRKIQAEPGPLVEGGPVVNPRWVGSGWTIFNNKGKPVRQYEPFFSRLPEKRHQFEFGVQAGVSSILFYDPVERVVATLHPNHTYEKVVFDPWRQTTYDVNDTVAANGAETGDPRSDEDIKGYVAKYFKTQPNTWQTWHQERITGAKGPQEKSAAEKAAKHANTPTIAHFDTLGRPFLTLAHNGFNPDGTPIQFPTRVHPDIEGNQREVRDAIMQNGAPLGRIVMRYDYDLLGGRIHQASMEAGERWMINDVAGKPIRAWDSRGHAFRGEYDPLRRPLRSFVIGADPANPNRELLTERLVYGEQHPEDESRNLRGKLYLRLDQAGVVANESLDFKGNPLSASRRLAREYKQTVDWSTINAALPASATAKLDPAALAAALAPLMDADTFTSRSAYDALNRIIQIIAPRSDQPGARRNVIQPVYNDASLLERVHAWMNHPTEPAGLLDAATAPPSPVGVNNIDYNARGQRLRIEYKNGAITRYAYDRETFRLIHLYTRRGATFTEDCVNPQPPPPTIAAPDEPPSDTACGLQNLRYTYDPAGNITHIRDDAQQTIYFRNKRVEPSADYTYDALYRLIEATGREHLGQVGGAPILHSHNDQPRIGIDWSANDGNAMGTYVEQYAYDAVGNFLSMRHRGSDPANPGWNRTYAYNEASLTEPAKRSNRLSSATVGDNNPITERYVHDAHGNIIRMPHLANHPDPQAANMHWDYKDQMRQADLGGGGVAYYVYDAAGQRARKVWEKAPGLIEERIYLGGFEVFRRRNGAGTVTLERETLHIMDDKQRIALVEARTQGNDPAPPQLIRYQFGNHLGSASLELDDQARIISYEEYTPYGSTAYQAVRSQTETPKRYRYTGKERDEESGLYYHGARYYVAWLGRWVSCDPSGIRTGTNLYQYGANQPTRYVDPDGRDPSDPSKKKETAPVNSGATSQGTGKTEGQGKKEENKKDEKDKGKGESGERAETTAYLFGPTQSAGEEPNRKVFEAMVTGAVGKGKLTDAQLTALWRTVSDTKALGFTVTVKKPTGNEKDYSVTVGGIYKIFKRDKDHKDPDAVTKTGVDVALYVQPVGAYSVKDGKEQFSTGFSATGAVSSDLSENLTLDMNAVASGATSADLSDDKTKLSPTGSFGANAALTIKPGGGWQVQIAGGVTWTSGYKQGQGSTTGSTRFDAGIGVSKQGIFGLPFGGIYAGISNEAVKPPFTAPSQAEKTTTGTVNLVVAF